LATAEKLLALVALARKNVDEARAHAASAQDAQPSTPHLEFVEGLIAFADARYDEALAHFRKAEVESERASVHVPDLHFKIAQTLERLDRWSEAVEQLEREVELFPRNLRARASLAVAFKTTGQDDAAERTLAELTSIAPTPEGYSVAARAWTAMGDAKRAEALRAEGRRRFRSDPALTLLTQVGKP
jgi:tetratricopeptide (TPR) repeat protein